MGLDEIGLLGLALLFLGNVGTGFPVFLALASRFALASLAGLYVLRGGPYASRALSAARDLGNVLRGVRGGP